MKLLVLLTAVVASAAILATAPLGAAAASKQQIDRSVSAQVKNLRGGIRWNIRRTHHWQDLRGVSRTPSAHAERHVRAVGYLRWDLRKWAYRRIRAKHAYLTHRLPATNDWLTAVRIVQRIWPGTSSFLINCSAHEGGHGIWVWNGGAPYGNGVQPSNSSGAGGWMQYMSGTFWGNFHNALAAAGRVVLPSGAASWTSPLGQAFAAGWTRFEYVRGAYPGSWPWNGDGYCA